MFYGCKNYNTVYAQIRIVALNSNSKKIYWYECHNTLIPKLEVKKMKKVLIHFID